MKKNGIRGIVLIQALFLLIILFALGVAIFGIAMSNLQFAFGRSQYFKALMAARSGANYAVCNLKSNSNWYNNLSGSDKDKLKNVSAGEGSYEIEKVEELETNPRVLRVISVGKYRNIQRKISVVLKETYPFTSYLQFFASTEIALESEVDEATKRHVAVYGGHGSHAPGSVTIIDGPIHSNNRILFMTNWGNNGKPGYISEQLIVNGNVSSANGVYRGPLIDPYLCTYLLTQAYKYTGREDYLGNFTVDSSGNVNVTPGQTVELTQINGDVNSNAETVYVDNPVESIEKKVDDAIANNETGVSKITISGNRYIRLDYDEIRIYDNYTDYANDVARSDPNYASLHPNYLGKKVEPGKENMLFFDDTRNEQIEVHYGDPLNPSYSTFSSWHVMNTLSKAQGYRCPTAMDDDDHQGVIVSGVLRGKLNIASTTNVIVDYFNKHNSTKVGSATNTQGIVYDPVNLETKNIGGKTVYWKPVNNNDLLTLVANGGINQGDNPNTYSNPLFGYLFAVTVSGYFPRNVRLSSAGYCYTSGVRQYGSFTFLKRRDSYGWQNTGSGMIGYFLNYDWRLYSEKPDKINTEYLPSKMGVIGWQEED